MSDTRVYSAAELYSTLEGTGLPVSFGFFEEEQTPPYLIYIGDGQEQFRADNTVYSKENTFQVEYYFTKKDEVAEDALEEALLAGGFLYEKSADVFDESESVWVIYYSVWRK